MIGVARTVCAATAGCKKKAKRTQGPRARQHEIKRQTDDNRWQTEERIREQDQQSAAGEAADCQCRPARQSENSRNGSSGNTDRQGKCDDALEFSRPEHGPDIITHQ